MPLVAYPTCMTTRWARAFAVQYKQDLRFAEDYASYAGAMERLFDAYVVPHRAPDRPNLVVLNEDIGLLTAFIGARGAAARRCGREPGAIQRAFGLLGEAYRPQVMHYLTLFPSVSPNRALFLALSDVMSRAFLETFAALAARHGVYLVAGASLAPATTRATAEEAALLGDPQRPRGAPVYVACGPEVYNAAYLWGPDGALIGCSRKVNLTPEEGPDGLDLTAGRLGRDDVPIFDTLAGRLGIAISLDAFIPAYIAYLDEAGAEVLAQPEANPGPWAAYADMTTEPPGWQPQTWMASCWRAVQESRNLCYGINPFMVGNLFDLPFDGQSAIFARSGGDHTRGYYAGNAAPVPGEPDSGARPGFVALAPWVAPSDNAREALEERARALAPGSGAPEENAYRETCVWADLELSS